MKRMNCSKHCFARMRVCMISVYPVQQARLKASARLEGSACAYVARCASSSAAPTPQSSSTTIAHNMLWDKRGKWREWEGEGGDSTRIQHCMMHSRAPANGSARSVLSFLAPHSTIILNIHTCVHGCLRARASQRVVCWRMNAIFHFQQQQPPSQTLYPKTSTAVLQILCVGTWGAPTSRPQRLLGPHRKRHGNGSGMRQGLVQDIASTIGSRQLTRATMRDAKARVPS